MRLKCLWLILALLPLCACLDVEKSAIRYDIEKDLSGTLTVDFYGIHSSESVPEKRDKEMEEFLQGGYLEDADHIAEEWAISQAKASLSNKTAQSCDGQVTGSFSNLVKSLAPFLESNTNYEISKDSKRLRVVIHPSREEGMTLVVVYAGEILETNAPKVDRKSGRMEWDLSKVDESGVQFTLSLQ